MRQHRQTTSRAILSKVHSELALAVTLAIGASSVNAAIITVTDGGDSGTASSCTLRQAVESANNDAPGPSSCDSGAIADFIVFDPSLVNATITLAGNALSVAASTTLNINGSGQTIDAAGMSQVLDVDSHANLTLSSLTITGGYASDVNANGGGIGIAEDVTLGVVGSTIIGNQSTDQGGGIGACCYDTINIAYSTISGNQAARSGGGMYAFGSQLNVVSSTISDNAAIDGGGVYASFGSTLRILNSTISGNHVDMDGGGVWIHNSVILYNSTISGNSADNSAGGLFVYPSSTVTADVTNTILAGNTAPASPELAASSGAISMLSSLLGTAMQVNYSGNDNIFTDSPELGALADNGGLNLTMLPEAGSPAIDVGDNSLIAVGITMDQRGSGFARIVNGTVDMGAVEVQGGGTVSPSVPVPIRSPWALVLLGALLAWIGGRRRRVAP